MPGTHELTRADRANLHAAAQSLHAKFRGVFCAETIESLLLSSYDEIAATATVPNWLITGAERFTRQRLQALAHAQDTAAGKAPAVLFLCMRNAARSQMALGWFNHLAGGKAVAWSAGSQPAGAISRRAVAAMAEAGIDISGEFAKPWNDEFMRGADVVITMGCGDTFAPVPGKRYEDWELQDPSGKTLEEMMPLRDEIRDRVADLLQRLGIA